MHRSSIRLRLLFPVILLLPATLPAATPPAAYTELRNARPDGRTVPVAGMELERDAYRFKFESGAFHFLKPVGGRTVGAVFVGHGSYRLSPATENERRQLALSVGADRGFETLTDEFDDLVLLFADDTAQEIELHAPVRTGAPDPRATDVYERYLKRQRKDFKINFHVRLLKDLLNNPGLTSGVFMALVEGRKYPPALAAVDPDGAEALGLFARLGGEDTIFLVANPNRGGLWYHCDRRAEVEHKHKSPEKRLTDALDYTIDTAVEKDADLAGTTTIRFKTLVPGVRVLPILLTPTLRLQEGSFALETAGAEPAWKPAAFVQEAEKEDATAAVVFPEPLAKGATVRLRLSYKGDKVLIDGGDKNYYVGARESWYPNVGIFSDPALFDLTYRVPAGNGIVSVGKRVEERTEGKQTISRWQTDHPVQVAGFNYGQFKKTDKVDETSRIDVEVYTNPGTPNIVREINAAMSGEAIGQISDDFEGGAPRQSLGKVNTGRLAEAALSDGLNSARLFTAYFGPLPQAHVAITQQSDFAFGQSWPSLIFMPYISFLDGTQRQRLGMVRAKDFVDQVGFHEFAHQWWGHLVGAETYRDQWLEEGFAEFSAGLAVQHTQGWPQYDRFWRERRKEILEKVPGNAVAPYEAGPISQGWRLSTQRSPSAYRLMIYPKGGYVLHMLRMLMFDGGSKDQDARFIAMMKDYTSTYGGKFASTADFQKVVERHMVPAMNATGNGKMDWFFNQWVYGTEVPRYAQDLKVESAGEETRIHGTIRQEGVSKDFRALVPIYVELGKNQTARVGLVPLVGEASVPVDLKVKLPKKAVKALINAHGEVLA
ncbi:MAG TPA: M1 family aminopeptidase, partial [Thermoanaerobaculia bacterium]|nr:M1 family aminopeptidase [Thermoanaerobaculia bacterium]